MFLFSKKEKVRTENIVRENPEIVKAREYLNSIHPVNHVLYGHEPYHYIQTSYKGNYARYHFYKSFEKRLIYIVLSDEERSKVEKTFKDIMGEQYIYQDTILSCIFGNVIQHRFYMSNGYGESRAFMTDNGEIGAGYFGRDD